MPRRPDLRHVMVIGSGPIVIGQACEFDYSGVQACRALRAEGLRVSLINSNPATIMTDPEFADATYIEPLTADFAEKVIAAERPDALLATLGGQTALNIAVTLHSRGVLDQYNVELIGADIEAIQRGEDRQRFKEIMHKIGLPTPRGVACRSLDEVNGALAELGLPLVIRPSFTMGGLGSGVARTPAELDQLAAIGLALSPVTEVLVEESVLGWKEYELELMRDRHDNVVVVCSIENVDPMGVHTGDSVTVAPAMTLTDREYQRMRDAGIAALREVGIDTGGCNIQFAVNPADGRMVVIEMNPRVSRSSALASKATGFPIAKIAAKLAIGYTLDEISNDITGQTLACYEPALDYVVVKVPRFAFEKFPDADPVLTTTMKSVGEAMAIGRNFAEALGKALRSAETSRSGFWTSPDPASVTLEATMEELRSPHDGRLYTVERALREGADPAEVARASGIDTWFVGQIAALVALRAEVKEASTLGPVILRRAKHYGLSDLQIAALRPELPGEDGVRALRHQLGVRPVFKMVDTCAGEFAARTPYYYSAYELDPQACGEVPPQSRRPKVLILGSGPNRIGQGIEFDYSCVHAVQALRGAGYETIMVNSNPETVSTDYDTSDRLYFEPLTCEDVLEVVAAEQQSGAGGPGLLAAIVALGGQTPLRLADRLARAGVPIAGTPPEVIHRAEDRGAFGRQLALAGLPAPRHGTASSLAQASAIADKLGYPVLIRPSYVLGGQGMEIVHSEQSLASYLARAAEIGPARPVLVDQFLTQATEIDVDALFDGDELYIGAVLEHIEEAGVHSGDSACVLPAISLGDSVLARVREYTQIIARDLGVRGLLNVQYALKDDTVYVLEANPRASRTVPFVSKATAVPLAKAAALIMLGTSIGDLRGTGLLPAAGDGTTLSSTAAVAVKEAVLPFRRFRTRAGQVLDPVLGPEMKSTGEVMGIDVSFGKAFAKSQAAAMQALPATGTVFVSVSDRDRDAIVRPVRRLAELGLEVCAAPGTAAVLMRSGVPCRVMSGHAGEPGDIVSMILAGEVSMAISTPDGNGRQVTDGQQVRVAAVTRGIPYITTVHGAVAAVRGIESLIREEIGIRALQDWQSLMREHYSQFAVSAAR
jgi:carbamoyl-phosphate synthase large subunit